MINIYIGFDPRETVAFHVLAHSIQQRTSQPIAITPLNLKHLADIYNRSTHNLQSTEFSFSRFLVPYLSNYRGWSIFMDCDMLVLDDIAKLWGLRDGNFAVQVVKHKHVPTEMTKFLGQTQTTYNKKNWSSVMLFNNERCNALTPKYVSTASGLDLHQFKWLAGDHLIGGLPKTWNHLVGYDEFTKEVSNVHFTTGGPYFPEYQNCEYSNEWFSEKENMLGTNN